MEQQQVGRKSSARRLNVWRTDGFWSALAGLAVVTLCVITGLAQRLDVALYDAAIRTTTPAPLPEIAIVNIDDASLATLGPWPWSRDIHARLIDQLAASGAKTIVHTAHFTEPQSDRGLGHVRKIRELLAASGDNGPLATELSRIATDADQTLDTDARLASAIQRAGNVLLASRYAPTGTPAALPSYVRRSTLPDPGSFAKSAQSAQHPIGILGAAAAAVGHLYPDADNDGQTRRVPLLLRYDNTGIPSLALLAAQHSLHLSSSDLHIQDAPPGLRLGGLHIATDATAVMRPRVQTTPGGSPAFPTHSFTNVLDGKTPASSFQGKIVLVGSTAAALAQQGGQGPLYPVDTLARTVSSIRQGLGAQEPAWGPWASVLAAAGALLYVALLAHRTQASVVLGVGAALALTLAAVGWGLLHYAGLWIALALPTIALAAGIAANLLLGWKNGRQHPASAEAAEADRMMGLALHGQGQLDMAFERLRKVPVSDALLENLYHLAEDFERKRNFAKAKAVYEHILRHNRQYKDTRSRYKRARAKADSSGPNSQPALTPPQGASASPRLPGDATLGMPMLGRYQIDREIGKGAMGVVYLGRDPKIGRVVAIKTLALCQEFEGDALIDARARFFREAETAGRLQHPHIVTIFDAGEEHDLAYIAMEFLKGRDLAHACEKEHLLPVHTVLSIAACVADALDYAHAHNVVHRDIKPANIMFDSTTHAVKVTDFGIARITDSSKTRTGLVLGTPSFMSPEQLAGKKVDGRSDLYSLGISLFQLLTGTLPLRGASMTELMHKIASVDAPDIRELRPDLSTAVARVVALALQKRPEARYQTGRQFAADLRQAAAGTADVGSMPAPETVVYDADRDATGHEMTDFQETVMDPPAVRGASAPPVSGAP
ncbi:MAG: serine/threonine-protein kinase [Acidovorax sp.]|uniref:CHASE2 domain-containing serine/threonine-protein kinase n=1 Tax=Acidovorax sp. TaxID=1872122 RepID=UPI002621EAFC|nr:serine/threonine-protein kinase [Acidovorax sp.]MDH4417291.1 serine/threonine-protein kinase [Acidovorax sp.]